MPIIPTYTAIQIVEVINEQSGHTKPWVVVAQTPSCLKKFVVKMYSSTDVEEYHRVSKEVIGNILAKEFDLAVPEIAFIEFDPSLVQNLPPAMQVQYDEADPRVKFATELLEGVLTANVHLPKSFFNGILEIDTLYAFDNLIRNADRGTAKPNLLLTHEEAYLIDHELAFEIKDGVGIDFDSLVLDDKFTKYHLFYYYLNNSHSKHKLFSDFEYYLEQLNVNCLKPYFEQLINEGFTDCSELIIPWIVGIKTKKSTFVNLLRGSL